ncbi:hypothetical protein MKEN_00108500 [Mycena kentingensis (nom. inval.)]|nr:hypothetical protein MKEN_00108500 [Mycena kentingensis (nom. inval.)]
MESLPVDLIAQIVGELPLLDVIKMSQLSRHLKLIASDDTLNVWRRPILRAVRTNSDQALKNLSVYTCVPRHNWITVLATAKAHFILFDLTLPNLKHAEWEEAFRRRFLPSWVALKQAKTWKEAFLSMLHQLWHRSHTSCTVTEAWTKYLVLNRNGSANLLEVSTRNFDPTSILNDMRLQQNLYQLPLRARLIVELADIRILALGSLDYPRSSWAVNENARLLLHPDLGTAPTTPRTRTYSVLQYPTPAESHNNYPFTANKREISTEELGMEWVGGLLIVAQVISGSTAETDVDQDLLSGPRKQQYASFSWDDLWAIAPWLRDSISRCIDGQGLGL